MTDLLLALGFLAAFLLLSPCSPVSIWKGGSCAWRPRPRTGADASDDRTPRT